MLATRFCGSASCLLKTLARKIEFDIALLKNALKTF